jgi:hypothetical protein
LPCIFSPDVPFFRCVFVVFLITCPLLIRQNSAGSCRATRGEIHSAVLSRLQHQQSELI